MHQRPTGRSSVVDLPKPNRLVFTTGGQEMAIGAELQCAAAIVGDRLSNSPSVRNAQSRTMP